MTRALDVPASWNLVAYLCLGFPAEEHLDPELERHHWEVRSDISDVVFTRWKVAVFADGCFWHGCPEHATWPKQNAEFWRQKIETNRLRGADTNSRLLEVGWTVLRFWEHESPVAAAAAVAQAVNAAKARRCEAPVGAHKKK